MQKKSALLGGAALGVLLAVGMSASADAKVTKHHHKPVVHGPSIEDQKIEALTDTVSALEAKLNEETQARQATEAQVQAAQADATAARADAQAARTELSEQIQTIPGAVQGEINTAIAANKPKTDKIYYKGITVTLGGFLEAAGIYRSKSDLADVASSYAKIPYGNAALSHVGELRGTARQSRVSFLAQGDINPTTHAAFYGEFDFLGGAQTANSNESNSYNPRIRNVYGTIDWDDLGLHMLAGQSWSLVTLNSHGISPRNEVSPTAIDAQYVPGFAWARQPQIRVTKDFADKQLWLAVSLENPQTTFNGTTTASGVSALTSQTAISGFDSANSLSLNHAPDVVGKLAYEPAFGSAHPIHMEVFGLWRDYYDRINVAGANGLGLPGGIYNSDTSGGGVGGSITAQVVPNLIDLQGSILTGRGIGRYGSAQLSDATLEPDGKIAPIPETMWLVGGTLHATKALDLYAYAGDEREEARLFHTGTIGTNATLYGFGIPGTGSAAGCLIDGGTCTTNTREVFQITTGLWDKAYTGPYGQIRIGLQYSHTELTAFTDYSGGLSHGAPVGAGYTPKTNDDMVFTSFRYYPF